VKAHLGPNSSEVWGILKNLLTQENYKRVSKDLQVALRAVVDFKGERSALTEIVTAGFLGSFIHKDDVLFEHKGHSHALLHIDSALFEIMATLRDLNRDFKCNQELAKKVRELEKHFFNKKNFEKAVRAALHVILSSKGGLLILDEKYLEFEHDVTTSFADLDGKVLYVPKNYFQLGMCAALVTPLRDSFLAENPEEAPSCVQIIAG